MIEFTLDVGDKINIGGDIVLQHLEKTHPLAIPAHSVRLGIAAPISVIITRGELAASKVWKTA